MYAYIFPDTKVDGSNVNEFKKNPKMKRLYSAWPKWIFHNIKNNSVLAKPIGIPGVSPSDKPSMIVEKFSIHVPTTDGLIACISPDLDIHELQRGLPIPIIKITIQSGKILAIPIALNTPKSISIDTNDVTQIGDYVSQFGVHAYEIWKKLPKNKQELEEFKEKEIIITDAELIKLAWLAVSYGYNITKEVYNKVIVDADVWPICSAAWGQDPNQSSPEVII